MKKIAGILIIAVVSVCIFTACSSETKSGSRIVVENEQELRAALKVPGASVEINSNTTITITSTIEVAQRVHLFGNNNILLASSPDFTMFSFKQGSDKCVFENMRIVGQKSSTVNNKFQKSNVGIKVNRAYRNVFKNIHFENFSGSCMVFQGNVSDDVFSHGTMVLGCSFSNSFVGISHTDRYEYSIISNCFFSRCRIGIVNNSGNWNITGNTFVTCATPLLSVNKTTAYGVLSEDNWGHGIASANKIEHSASGGGIRWSRNLEFPVGESSFVRKGGVYIEGVIPPTMASNSFYFSNLEFKNPNTAGNIHCVNSSTFQNSHISCNIPDRIKLVGCTIRNQVIFENVMH